MAEVHFWGALRPVFGGATSVFVEAKTIREMFRILSERHPGFDAYLKRGIAVSIDGRIFRDSWDQELPPGAEIYLLPRIAGG
jgi:sulfur-carrier protein